MNIPNQYDETATLITDVSTLDGGLWTCAAAAIFAMVLRWFIWLIAMVTDAGGRLTGIRGWGIIIKGSSSPKNRKHIDHHWCAPVEIINDMSLRVKPLENTLIVMVKEKKRLFVYSNIHSWLGS